ncbi:MAG: glycosyltransferase [Deinococcota bacterium]|nr:glycosyltransferase [Deinococcota bacterium]
MPNKPNVIHSVLSWLPQTETWIYNQLHYLPATVEAHVVCDKTENLDQFGWPLIHHLPRPSSWQARLEARLPRLKLPRRRRFIEGVARDTRANLLHSHYGHQGWEDMGATRRTGLKHIVTFYGLDVNYLPNHKPVWRRRYGGLFARVDRILCEGPHMARCLVKLGCPEDKIRVHHLGVTLESTAFRPRVWAPEQPLRVLIAASFREKKGIPYALEALGRLSKDVAIEVTIIGDANQEARSRLEKEKILATIQKHSLGVRMLGYQPHRVLVAEAYKHHIFLSPSVTAADGDTEGGAPVSIIEMLASGMPVISTHHCDIPEVVKGSFDDFLAPERDVEGLVARLKALLELPCWEGRLRAGRRYIEEEYSAKAQGLKLAALYGELMR